MNTNNMHEQWHERYRWLEKDLAFSDRDNTMIIAQSHWHALENAMKGYSFRSIEEEIYFFKKVKPRFTAKLELFHLMKAGVKNPLLRLKKFEQKHRHFVDYYTKGGTENDAVYFTRISGLNSSKDYLVAQLLALQELSRWGVFAE